ncbi:unnamed protein product, partial [Iphiclides podalirius]
MQLILDAETTIDIQNKMSGMNEATFDEKFTKSIIEKFSDDLHHGASDLKGITLLDDGKEKQNIENNIPNGESNNQEENTDIPTIISNIESNVNNEENERSSEDLDNSIERRNASLTEDCEKESNGIENVTKVQSDTIPKLIQDENFHDGALMQSDDQCNASDNIIELDSNLANFSESTEYGASSNEIKFIEPGNIADENTTENNETSNLETEVEIKLDSNKVVDKDVEQKRDYEDLGKIVDQDDGKLKTVGDNDLDSNEELRNILLNKKNTKDEDVISNSLTDSINKNDIELNTTEVDEKVELREKSEEKEQSKENKSNYSEHANHKQQVLEDKAEIVNESLPCDKTEKLGEKKKSQAYKLSNTLDILSDDEDEQQGVSKDIQNVSKYSQNISLVDDDDVMLIEENIGEKNKNNTGMVESISEETDISNTERQSPSCTDPMNTNKDAVTENNLLKNELDCTQKDSCEKESHKPILPSSFLKTCKKNLADMTREDLEEFCILKIVESVVDKSNLVNGMRNSPPVLKPEKRTRLQSVTVDLTDDEPPSKMVSRSSPAPPVRLVPPQNLLAPQRQPFTININSPRKVYIPISSPQAQNIRPGQTILLRSVPPNPGPRPRGPSNSLPSKQSNSIRMNKVQSNRHPAPLPDAMKQYQPPNWKALPPAPDLTLSKVDNGIVISWKIEGWKTTTVGKVLFVVAF